MSATGTDRPAHSWFRSLNCDARYGVALLASLTLIALLCAAGEPAQLALRYDRVGLEHFQWWRLVTAHLVHLNAVHALLDGAALVGLWVLFAREYTPRRWLWILACAAACIDAGLWLLRPGVAWYLGASGVLHGALAAGAWAMYRRRDPMGALLMVLLVFKLIYEQHHGGSLFLANLPVVVDAHAFGALGGLIGAVLPRSRDVPAADLPL